MLSRGASLGRKDEPGAVADPQLFQSSRLIVEHERILNIIQTIVCEKLTFYRFVDFNILHLCSRFGLPRFVSKAQVNVVIQYTYENMKLYSLCYVVRIIKQVPIS